MAGPLKKELLFSLRLPLPFQLVDGFLGELRFKELGNVEEEAEHHNREDVHQHSEEALRRVHSYQIRSGY